MKNSLFLIMVLWLTQCQVGADKALPAETAEALVALPYTPLALEDLSAFQETGQNWTIAGGVLADHTKDKNLVAEPGTGILVNQNDDTHRENLFTAWEHGDLELNVEVMIPKGSNSGIYFQGRYEIQLFDSWKKEDPTHADIGGIYQRWDDSRPEGEQGFEGHAPLRNAAKAPGLWQKFHIVFRAPRFNTAGEKVENARFEKVVLNGITIHEDVELFGPTRAAAFSDEAPVGPLMIQGDHGPLALRNISYKRYFEADPLALRDLRYQYYEIDGPITALPDFEALEMVREGATDSLVYQTLSERDERVAYIFSGQLEVAKAGDYLFTLYSDDGSRLYIHDDRLIDNDGKHDYEPKSGLIHLEEGTHELKLTYFNNNWGQGLTLFYEGPELREQPLVSRPMVNSRANPPQLTVQAEESPEMIRSFVMHEGEKLTHAISVGDPSGLHYSLDLRRGSLVKCWRGDFADVTEMWYHRGHAQLLHPLEMALETESSPVAALLDAPSAAYPTEAGPGFRLKGYDINPADQPEFSYQLGSVTVTDHLQPLVESGEILRTIKSPEGAENLFTRIAAGEHIQAVGNGYYSVAGKYYIRLVDAPGEPILRQQGGWEEMLFPLAEAGSEVSYAILW